MPVYLCQPGSEAEEPWRHGIQVYATPFSMDNEAGAQVHHSQDMAGDSSVVIATAATSNHQAVTGTDAASPWNPQSSYQQNETEGENPSRRSSATASSGLPIRRVRHSEVVLVDDVCVAFSRYWLRLRWPGTRGGFAGYIALGKVGETEHPAKALSAGGKFQSLQKGESFDSQLESYLPETFMLKYDSLNKNDVLSFVSYKIDCLEAEIRGDAAVEDSYVAVEASEDVEDEDQQMREDAVGPNDSLEIVDNASMLPSEPFEASNSTLTCVRTGLPFPSSGAMQLMAIYDDGLSPPVTSAPLPSENVFCRICREGLHDDADEQQPSPTAENEAENTNLNRMQSGQSMSPQGSSENVGGSNEGDDNPDEEADDDIVGEGNMDLQEPQPSAPNTLSKGPVTPHPVYHRNAHAAENPMLAPCECSGSMAFVHYLCVEQWRCRSRHPEAQNGLNCETCGRPYALPPPSARPAVLQSENEDWLEAMPPHVMQALREPHIWWQIGAAIVRRRWLRPVAPVLMSPMVALYCRARRLLKKKGVARRRWACSLCRRRARWKCVRCLRSYYCSRQCQNVSWHIVHKHVCYKPSRWGWSVVVYGAATLLAFPGILRDPLMYDLGLGFIPASFYVMGILGGGIATVSKKMFGIDLRGRAFELVVILMTVWLVLITWGLVLGFFGDSSKCHGAFGNTSVSLEDSPTYMLHPLRRVLLQPAQSWFLMWDKIGSNSGYWLRKAMCKSHQEGCFEHLPHANADFFFEEHGGEKCASDLALVSNLFLSAGVVALTQSLWKRRERQRRAMRRPNRQGAHAHQD